jgi:homoserine dehydrogenase
MNEGDGKTLRVALLGCGVVGSQVARLLREQADDLAVRTGARIEVAGIAVRRLSHPRPGIDQALLTTDAMGLAIQRDVDIVIEVIGGIEPARSLLLAAMKAGKSVVTATRRARRADPRRVEGLRRRPVLRGLGGRGDPAAAAAARVAGRGHRAPGARHRQRHHQLHPGPDGHLGR